MLPKLLELISVIGSGIATPKAVKEDGTFVPYDYGLVNTQTEGITRVILYITQNLFLILATISVAALIIGSIMYVTSLGNEERTGKAKKTITWAVVGTIVALLSWSLISIIVGEKSPLNPTYYHCSNGTQDSGEEGTDCGGDDCPACP